ncbi:MAG: NAD+ synthase [Candidatus Aminicenantes bacterium]|nr:NAD+ synthase [Candidatus Aminicenantes bacterium]
MKINPEYVTRLISTFIKEELAKFDFRKAILGLSGGLDSSVCAFLATRALGSHNVLALIMPYGKTFPEEVEDAQTVAALVGCRVLIIDIQPMVEAYFSIYPTDDPVLKGNKMARERMAILYDFSAREKALILGTSNKTELLIGYGTIHGDLACGINPLGDLYKTQIRQLADWLGVPEKIRKKKPTAGLWPGQTDEEEIGLSYDELDSILYELVDLRKSRLELISQGYDPQKVNRVWEMMRRSEFKRRMPPILKLSSRTVGHDFLYPYDWDR